MLAVNQRSLFPDRSAIQPGTVTGSTLSDEIIQLTNPLPYDHRTLERRMPFFNLGKELLGDIGGKRVLDYACGDGTSTTALLESWGAFVEGVDICPVEVSKAQNLFPDRQFLLLKDGIIPADEQSYDAAFCTGFSYSVPDPAPFRKACGEIVRVVKNGGMFVHVAPNPAWQRKLHEHQGVHDMPEYDVEDFIFAFERAGFCLDKISFGPPQPELADEFYFPEIEKVPGAIGFRLRRPSR